MPRPNPTRPYSFPGFRVALVREPGVKLAERPSLKTPAEAARVLAEYIGERDREVFVVALLTIRHRLIGAHTVSVGCLASSLVHPAMVMKPAILASAACLVLAHNHPSGCPEPSAEAQAVRSPAGGACGGRVRRPTPRPASCPGPGRSPGPEPSPEPPPAVVSQI